MNRLDSIDTDAEMVHRLVVSVKEQAQSRGMMDQPDSHQAVGWTSEVGIPPVIHLVPGHKGHKVVEEESHVEEASDRRGFVLGRCSGEKAAPGRQAEDSQRPAHISRGGTAVTWSSAIHRSFDPPG